MSDDDWYRKGARAVDDDMKAEILDRILAIWRAHPDLRLMQLIGNITSSDLYYVEDYDLVKALGDFYERTDST